MWIRCCSRVEIKNRAADEWKIGVQRSRRYEMKDIGRFKGGTGCQENQEKTDVGLSLCMIYLFILRSNTGSEDARRHSALRRCRNETGALY